VYRVRERSFITQRMMGLVMILIFAVMIVLQLAATSAAELFVALAGVIPLIGPNLAPFVPLAGFVVSALAAFLLCLTVFYVVPNLRLTLRETLPGTLFATVALVILAQGFPLYARLSGSSGQYDQVFGLALLLMTWSYLVAHAFIVGAELNAILCPPCVLNEQQRQWTAPSEQQAALESRVTDSQGGRHAA
jgi:membrane protein